MQKLWPHADDQTTLKHYMAAFVFMLTWMGGPSVDGPIHFSRSNTPAAASQNIWTADQAHIMTDQDDAGVMANAASEPPAKFPPGILPSPEYIRNGRIEGETS